MIRQFHGAVICATQYDTKAEMKLCEEDSYVIAQVS